MVGHIKLSIIQAFLMLLLFSKLSLLSNNDSNYDVILFLSIDYNLNIKKLDIQYLAFWYLS